MSAISLSYPPLTTLVSPEALTALGECWQCMAARGSEADAFCFVIDASPLASSNGELTTEQVASMTTSIHNSIRNS